MPGVIEYLAADRDIRVADEVPEMVANGQG